MTDDEQKRTNNHAVHVGGSPLLQGKKIVKVIPQQFIFPLKSNIFLQLYHFMHQLLSYEELERKQNKGSYIAYGINMIIC